ncbi:hypothetical protein Ciccas_011114 [Cichlidogyrus casuarinus]|uniref:Uncharacterized protein n=1 Tax=Cichlidogyrus casuarinus TaxID=1844966 RepID=A0ABD2PTD0_9PLAT
MSRQITGHMSPTNYHHSSNRGRHSHNSDYYNRNRYYQPSDPQQNNEFMLQNFLMTRWRVFENHFHRCENGSAFSSTSTDDGYRFNRHPTSSPLDSPMVGSNPASTASPTKQSSPLSKFPKGDEEVSSVSSTSSSLRRQTHGDTVSRKKSTDAYKYTPEKNWTHQKLEMITQNTAEMEKRNKVEDGNEEEVSPKRGTKKKEWSSTVSLVGSPITGAVQEEAQFFTPEAQPSSPSNVGEAELRNRTRISSYDPNCNSMGDDSVERSRTAQTSSKGGQSTEYHSPMEELD